MKRYSIYRKLLVTLFLLQGIFLSEAQSNLTADKIIEKSAGIITASKGLSAQFKITANGQSGIGTVKSMGDKFMVTLPDVQVWYNGVGLYTYNSRTQETTVVTPSAEELMESNPLLYVKAYQKSFTPSFASEKKTGKYIINMLPKNKANDIKKLTFTINSTTFEPEKITAEFSGGNKMNIEITSFKKNASISASEFEYPQSKYPKAEIIDLR